MPHTKEWPPSVTALVTGLGHRADRLNSPGASGVPVLSAEELRPLLLVQGSASDQPRPAHRSMVEMIRQADEGDRIPFRVQCLVTAGDEEQPYVLSFRLGCHQLFDVCATVRTLMAYYEAREGLPSGLADITSDWLAERTNRVGYGDDEMEESRDREGKEATELVRNAIVAVSDITEAPLTTRILGSDNLAYSSHRATVAGRATWLFCQTYGNPVAPSYRPELATLFECRARDLLAEAFIGEVGYRFGLSGEGSGGAYRQLPASRIPGALTHLPTPSMIQLGGPPSLE